ncbi:hypothetical protein [Mixta sp. BE291]
MMNTSFFFAFFFTFP